MQSFLKRKQLLYTIAKSDSQTQKFQVTAAQNCVELCDSDIQETV